MTAPPRWLAAGGAALLLACSSGDGADLSTFCDRFEALTENDPFAELLIASPGEMRDAFAELDDAATGLADVAPAPVAAQAERYARAVDALIESLAPAGYDPIRLDTAVYLDGVDAYRDASISLDRAASGACGR